MAIHSSSFSRIATALALLLLLAGTPLSAGAITFSDSNFTVSDWSVGLVPVSGPGGSLSVTATQESTGGNPGAFRQTTLEWTGPGNIAALHERLGLAYNPAVSGAIDHIDFSFDTAFFGCPGPISSPCPGTVAYLGILRQGGTDYFHGFVTPTSSTWISTAFTDLHASDWARIHGLGPFNPDFSPSGALMTFGFETQNGTCCSGQDRTLSGIDNWSVTINPVPEPSTLLLLGSGLAGLGAGAWRRHPRK